MSEKLSAKVIIPNKRGLHARASAKVVEASGALPVRDPHHQGRHRRQRPLHHGADDAGGLDRAREVEITAEGPDAAEAMKAILALVEAKFGEE